MFRTLPIADRGIPPHHAAAEQAINAIVHALHAGKHVAIHCRMGIGRSAMIAAAILVVLGETPERALASIQTARGLPVLDTPEQRQWSSTTPRSGPTGHHSHLLRTRPGSVAWQLTSSPPS